MYPWYKVIVSTEPLQQGDLLDGFPVVVPPTSIGRLNLDSAGVEDDVSEFGIESFNVVVMTQSCDFQKLREDDEVILCPRHDYSVASQEEPKFSGEYGWKNLINDRIMSAYILDRCELNRIAFDYQIVNLGRVFSARFAFVKQFASSHGDRVRLMPPYREALAQAFARRFMRVGLPVDLPRTPPDS